jgi:hypothetical protein
MRSWLVALALGSSFFVGGAVRADTVFGGNYVIEYSAPATDAGALSAALVTIRPSGSWKLNEEYPFRVDIAASGVRATRAKLTERDVALEAHRAELTIGYVAHGAGALELTLSFGTCDGRSCAAHKQALRIPVSVRPTAR